MKKLNILVFVFLLSISLSGQPPVGYYSSATGLTGTPLQLALHNIIKNHTQVSYDYLWTAFQTTDDKTNGKVWDMYSDIPGGTPPYEYTFISDQCGSYTGEGSCYNREHSFPESWFGATTPMRTDLFHIYPTDGYVNGRRGNLPYGKVGTADWTSQNGCKLGPCITTGYSGDVFEPIDAYKGDFARSYFYMATRYYTEDANWPGSPMVTGSQLNQWALDMLLDWNALDPVSQKEIDRNNAIYAIQNNRNPFIDNQGYADAIWSPYLPEPSNYPTNFSAHNIHLQWTDATGTYLPDGYLVRMSAVSYAAIPDPVDGVPVADGPADKNVPFGTQEAWFINLSANTTYYFKLFSYSGFGSSIDYKTDGTVPLLQQSTTP